MRFRQLFASKAEKKTWRRLADDHVVGTPSGHRIERDDSYFVIRMTEMYLRNTRRLWRKFYPMLHGLERKGYLRSTKERVGKTMRRLYAITPKGRTVLGEAKGKVQHLFGDLFDASR